MALAIGADGPTDLRLFEQQPNGGSKEECAHILSGVAKVASRCCELANPAQVRQIASQTGVLFSDG